MRMNGSKVARTVLIGLGVLLAAEVVARAAVTVRLCWQKQCGASPLLSLALGEALASLDNLSQLRLDKDLGYVPKEGFEGLLSKKLQDPIKVTIDQNGYRASDNNMTFSKPDKVLVVGDSYTFGMQVSNHETWVSCLERKIGARVDNGGVFGYGPAQAVKRAVLLNKADPHAVVMLSVLAGRTFAWDRLTYRGGVPIPAVIKRDGKLMWADTPDAYRPGTRFNPTPNRLVYALNAYSVGGWFLTEKLLLTSQNNLLGDRLTQTHPEAATELEILDWTIQQLAAVPVKRKILTLQYDAKLDDPKATRERQLLLEAASKYGVESVDPYDALISKPKSKLWVGHYTPYANTVVCEELAKAF
jgi:hypothetical protein